MRRKYSALAEHFEEGGDYEKAALYFRWSASRARRTSANTDAIAFSRKRVACLEKLPTTSEVQKQVIDATGTLANNWMSCNYYVEARDAVAPVIDLVHQLDYRKRLPALYVVIAANLILVEERHNEDETQRYLIEGQRLALEEKYYQPLWTAYYYKGTAHAYNCEFAEGESCFLRMMEMSEAEGNVQGLVIAMFNLAHSIYAWSGRPEEALKYSQKAMQLALQADDPYLKGGAYWAFGTAFFRKGLFPEAEENLTLAIETNQKTDFAGPLFLCFWYLGLIRFAMGRYQEAQECCDGLLAVYERIRIFPSIARSAQILKVAAGVRGRLNPALDAVLNFDLEEIRMRIIQRMAAHGMGEIYLHIDDKHMGEAEGWIKKAIRADERNQIPWDLATDYALYADFFRKRGDPAQAKEKLNKAIELMRGIGADGWVKKYEEELAGL